MPFACTIAAPSARCKHYFCPKEPNGFGLFASLGRTCSSGVQRISAVILYAVPIVWRHGCWRPSEWPGKNRGTSPRLPRCCRCWFDGRHPASQMLCQQREARVACSIAGTTERVGLTRHLHELRAPCSHEAEHGRTKRRRVETQPLPLLGRRLRKKGDPFKQH